MAAPPNRYFLVPFSRRMMMRMPGVSSSSLLSKRRLFGNSGTATKRSLMMRDASSSSSPSSLGLISSYQRHGLQRLLSTSSAEELPFDEGGKDDIGLTIPTKHSWHDTTIQSWRKRPPICLDITELQEMTQELLETPIGHLYTYTYTDTSNNNLVDIRKEQEVAWQAAFETIEKAEYLARGYNALIPTSLHSAYRKRQSDGDEMRTGLTQTRILSSLEQLLQRMQDEGDMYLQVRAERKGLLNADSEAAEEEEQQEQLLSEESSGYEEESSSSDSSSGEESSDGENNEDKKSKKQEHDHPFAPPGPTITLYDCLLDAMAVTSKRWEISQYSPMDFYRVAARVVEPAHYQHYENYEYDEDDEGTTLLEGAVRPTQITYNAALRGIVATAVSEPEPIRDEALQGGFGLYSIMTHDPNIPLNGKTIQYMLRLINKVFPTSRVKGNISVTLFHDACELGVVTNDLVQDVLRVHNPSNGPEFDIFLEEIQKEHPRHHRRHVRKYHHSKNCRY